MAFKYNVINTVVAKSRVLGDIAFEAASEKFENEKQDVITSFEKSDISRELIKGAEKPEAPNISETLTGAPGKPVGNLFSFIGFKAGTDVITPVKEALVVGWNIIKTKKFSVGRGGSYRITYNFTSKLDKSLLDSVSKLPFEDGSWLEAIEKGISGVTNYLAGIFGSESRSGGGVQIKNEIPAKSYSRKPYLFTFIREALARLK